MKQLAILFILTNIYYAIYAQVGIDNSNPDPSSILDLTAVDKGLLIPRMTTTERNGITSPANGLLVFDTDKIAFYYYNAGSWYAVNGWTTTDNVSGNMHSTSSGNVGVGVSNPQNKLDVEGGLAVGSAYSGTRVAPANGMLVQGNTGIGTYTPQNKLDVEGSAVIGSSFSGSTSAPSNSLLVQRRLGVSTSNFTTGISGLASTSQVKVEGICSDNIFHISHISHITTGSCSPSGVPFIITGTNYLGQHLERFKVDPAGNCSGTSFTPTSDTALKKNITTIGSSLSDILTLSGYTYNWKNPMDTLPEIGLLAQEVEKVFPELVEANMNGLKTLNYDGLIAPLIEAIKEQQVMIEQLQEEIELLK